MRAFPILLALLAASSARAQEPLDPGPLVGAQTEFACDLYGALRARESGNFFYSPYGISSALVMTWAGARGETAQEMGRTLHVDSLGEETYPLAAALAADLDRREDVRVPKGADPFRLRVANALWGQTGYDFQPEFLGLLASDYRASLRMLDFVRDPDGSRRTINGEIEKATEDRIRDLLQPDDVTVDTRLVLTNAIYFKASWFEAFPTTRDGAFVRLDGTEVTAPFMANVGSMPYARSDGLEAIEIPYVGREVGMLVLVPARGSFAEFEKALTAERLAAIVAGMRHTEVDLALPRFEVRSRFALREALGDLGMKKAFEPSAADFSGMDGTRELYIGSVVHQSFVKIDEKGTEAAAATAVVMMTESARPDPVEVRIDRPFVFLIRDRKTGTVLFAGRVVDPKAGG